MNINEKLKLIEEVKASNLKRAIDICKEKGDGDIMKGLDWVKEVYKNRPFDMAYADLKVVIDVMEENLIK
ncbi:MAG: hypothetical protein KBT03_13165 [Bacteroidales bacterium]|nr:hypothetical protein [Candidatus Scybalousia scybalohippi]